MLSPVPQFTQPEDSHAKKDRGWVRDHYRGLWGQAELSLKAKLNMFIAALGQNRHMRNEVVCVWGFRQHTLTVRFPDCLMRLNRRQAAAGLLSCTRKVSAQLTLCQSLT